MNKYFKPIISLLLILMLIPLSFCQQRETKPVKLSMISESLYEILDGRGARGGLFIGDNAVLVIDAKMNKKSADQVFEQVKMVTDKPIRYLVNTHSDGDHITGNQFFPKLVTIIAHENCRKEFFHEKRNGEPSAWHNPDLTPFLPSITFQDKMVVWLGAKKVELWYFGVGHTTGDAVVYFPEEKTAFLGDQIFLGRPQLIHSYKGGNSFEHVKTLTKMLATLDAEKFCSGHSEISGRKVIMSHITNMKKRQKRVRELMAMNKSLAEIQNEFEENESRLIKAIHDEIKSL